MKESFAQVHAAELAGSAATAAESIDPALAAPRFEDAVTRLQSLAERASVALRGIETEPRNPTLLRRTVDELDRLASSAERIASSP